MGENLLLENDQSGEHLLVCSMLKVGNEFGQFVG